VKVSLKEGLTDTLSTVPFKAAHLSVPTEPIPWPNDRAERISVNSFGIGGANVHVKVPGEVV
jgi:acyl transferase domain-containing protein